MIPSTTTDIILTSISAKIDLAVILLGLLFIVGLLDFIRRFFMPYGKR